MFAKLFNACVALAGPPSTRELTLLLALNLALAVLLRDPFFIVSAAQGAGWLE